MNSTTMPATTASRATARGVANPSRGAGVAGARDSCTTSQYDRTAPPPTDASRARTDDSIVTERGPRGVPGSR